MKHMGNYLSRQAIHVSLATGVLILLLLTSAAGVFGQGLDWSKGKLVGLRSGTCIREGPGLNYRAHTRVPEDNWTVMVTDGPRQANGKTWYDTSRRQAGDPSGGTGWVMADQTDTNCASPQPVNPPPGNVTQPGNPPVGNSSPPSVPSAGLAGTLAQLRSWWDAQSDTVKWAVALVLLAVLVGTWRQLSSIAIRLVQVVIVGALIWWVLDQTRSVWESTWHGLLGIHAPDLAILLSLIPLLGWLLSLLPGRSR